MAENNDINDPDNYQTPEEAYTKSQKSGSPAVASTPGKNFIFLGLFVIILASILYFIFSGKSEKKDDNLQDKIFPPKPPDMGSDRILVPPLPPAPPPPIQRPIDDGTADDGTVEVSPEDKAQAKARMQSQMLIAKSGGLLGGGLGGKTDPNTGQSLTEINDNDPNVGFADSFFNQKDSPFATARKLGDTSRLITQGKILDAVLETPINTDIPGMIRAVVSRDIYAESGRAILVPKGSRLVGTYNSLVIRGNKRVNVIWSRVIRPDGIDIMIRSPGTDQLGTAGVPGDVDNKYLEIFASAFLVSAITIGVGAATDAIDPRDDSTRTQNTDGSTTTNTSATQDAGVKAVDMFGDAGTNLVNGFLNLKPTITIPQGTRVNVFVNRDLVFPAGIASTVKMVQ